MISIRNLRIRFSTIQTLTGINFSTNPNRIVKLLGPNKTKKTTTIEYLTNIMQPNSNSIKVTNINVSQDPNVAQHVLKLTPQALALYPNLNVIQNLQIFTGTLNLSKKRLSETIEQTLTISSLKKHTQTRIHTLNNNIQQQLNLNIALLHEPPIILYNEPTTKINSASRHTIFNALRQLRTQNRTIMYTTHYLKKTKELYNKIVIIANKKITKQKTPTQLQQLNSEQHGTLHLTIDPSITPQTIHQTLNDTKIAISNLQPKNPHLKNIILNLTQTKTHK